jgi:hypothetical protein
MTRLVCSEPVVSTGKWLQIHKLLIPVSVVAVFFVLTAVPVNAQCSSRPRYLSWGGGQFVEWLVDNEFSETTCTFSQGGWFFGNASRMTVNGICGATQNHYAKLGANSTLYQRFQHNNQGDSQFVLGFDIEGGNTQAAGWLDVWIYNETNNNWTLVDTFPNNSLVSCGHKGYSFNRPDWRGKLLYVYFDTTFYDDGNWKIDRVEFQQTCMTAPC